MVSIPELKKKKWLRQNIIFYLEYIQKEIAGRKLLIVYIKKCII